ncbi:MAG: hypothetical protein HC906_10755 [Bacteroidales bacterium]|nr:hypothetical protein [Bacteroidales bacterium]
MVAFDCLQANTINSPQLKEKNDVSVSGFISMAGPGTYNLQGAVAVADHVGIMTNLMHDYVENNHETEFNERKLKIYFGEFGGGYFTTFGSKKYCYFRYTEGQDMEFPEI